jgi:site-specific DNA recombinase
MSVAQVSTGGLVPLGDQYVSRLYKRVSDEDQSVEGRSLSTQDRNGLAAIRKEGWQLAGIYEDVQSGRRNDRLDYQRMLADIRTDAASGRRTVVVLGTLDRLGRNARERLRCWDEIEALGGRIYAADHGMYDWLTYALLSMLAQEESRRIGHRVRTSIADMWATGWHPPGRVRWGYRWRAASPEERAADAPTIVLEAHPDEAPYVQEAWRRVAEGASLRAVSRWIQHLPSEARGGRNLDFGGIRHLFRAPVYVARPHSGKDVDGVLERPVGRWPALVDDQTWIAVRANVDRGKRKLPAQASGKYLLTGLLKCDRCGARMGGRPKGRRRSGEIRRAYVCKGESLGARATMACKNRAVSAARIEQVVLVTVTELLAIATEPKVIDAARAAWKAEEKRRTVDPAAERIGTLEQQIAKIRTRMAGATQKLVDGDISKVAYTNYQTQLEADLKLAEEELARCRGRVVRTGLPPLYVVLEQVKGWYGAIQMAWAERPDAVRAVLAELMESVAPVDLGGGWYEARPVWTATGEALLRTVVRYGASANLGQVEALGFTNTSTCPTL